jgi:dihydroorotase
LYGLPIPRIAVASPANLVLVDLEREWTVGEGRYASRSQNCCFDGRRLHGVIELTVAAGVVVHAGRGARALREEIRSA